MKKTALVLAAYGSGNMYGRRAIQLFEAACRQRFPDFPVRWAFTSCLLRERLAGMRVKSDSVLKALQRLWHEKFYGAAIQPLQSIPGQEYGQVCEQAREAESTLGMRCAVGQPLLPNGDGAPRVARAILAHLPQARKQEEDVILMAHGARHPACALYGKLAEELDRLDGHVHLGTVNSPADLERILPELSSSVVWLLPLLSCVGKHTINDMAGADNSSWRSRVEAAGHECVPVIRGLCEYDALANIWLDNLAKAVHVLENSRGV